MDRHAGIAVAVRSRLSAANGTKVRRALSVKRASASQAGSGARGGAFDSKAGEANGGAAVVDEEATAARYEKSTLAADRPPLA